MKKCKKCHEEIKDYEYRFCPHCGYRIERLPEYPCNMCQNARYVTIMTDEGEKLGHSEFYCKYLKERKYDSMLYFPRECEGFIIMICMDCKKNPIESIMHDGACYKSHCKKCFKKKFGVKK